MFFFQLHRQWAGYLGLKSTIIFTTKPQGQKEKKSVRQEKEDAFLEHFSRAKYLYLLVHVRCSPKQQTDGDLCAFTTTNVTGSPLRFALGGCRIHC